MKQLIINSIKRSEDGIVCGITENGVSTCLWVKVEEQFREFLCDDRADGFSSSASIKPSRRDMI